METIGDRIRRYREARDMGPADLAALVGVSRQAVDKWEQGRTENIRLENLLKLCAIFQLRPEELIRGESYSLKEESEPYIVEYWPFTVPKEQYKKFDDHDKEMIDNFIETLYLSRQKKPKPKKK